MTLPLEPVSCDTFVVLPDLTSGYVIFGKNSDRPIHEVQEIVYVEGKKHEPGATVKVFFSITTERLAE